MIVVAGEALVDLVVDPHGRVTSTLGGAPFNTARTAARLGGDVAFVGALSTDRFGSLLRAQLVADGVDVGSAPLVDVPTTLAVAELDDDGTARYRFHLAGTSAPLSTSVPTLHPGDVLVTGGLALVLEPMATAVESAVRAAGGAVVVVDVNCRPAVVTDRAAFDARIERVLARAHLVKVSTDDLDDLLPGGDRPAAVRRLLDLGPVAVVVTDGPGPVSVVTRRGERSVPVDPVAVVDTVGAGDAFTGALVAWSARHGDVASVVADPDRLARGVHAAVRAAAVTCRRRGAEPPHRRDLGDEWFD